MDRGATEVTEAVEAYRHELVDLTSSFVAVASENPPGSGLVEAQEWLQGTLDHYGITNEVVASGPVGGDHGVVVGEIGAEGPVVYLHGHYDVVPAFDRAQFTPVVDGGAVVGRGAADMKGGLVAMLVAAVIHRDAGRPGRIRLVYVPDEETGGVNGSERLEELGIISRADAAGAIVAEPSHPDIWYAARGAFTVEVTVGGRAAHVGLHYTGANAFTDAMAVVQELTAYQATVAQHRTELRIEPEAARQSIMLIGGTAGGGTNFNIVPDRFSFTIDRRPNPDEDHQQARAELLGVLDQLATGHELTYRILQDVDPALTPPDHPLVVAVEEAVTAATGRHAPLTMCPGCLETRVYDRAGIPAVAFGPGPAAVMHGPDEHVPIANLVEACRAYVMVLQRLLG